MESNDDEGQKDVTNEIIGLLNRLGQNHGLAPLTISDVKDQPSEFCWFCGIHTSDVKRLISHGAGKICDECIVKAKTLLDAN